MNELAKTLAQAEKNRPSAINRLLSSVKNAAKEQWQQGEPYRAAVGGLLMGDVAPARDVLMQKSPVTPMTPENALNIALDWSSPMGMIGHTVYHGSPHRFNKFDMGKIGTGEGKQQQGSGMYFADRKDVAERYAYKEAQKRGMEDGHLYKVDIPDDAISRMASYESPLSAQPHNVKEVVGNMLDDDATQVLRAYHGWEDVEQAPFAAILDALEIAKGNNRAATTEALRSAGIPGLRYLDGGSRGTGQGTYNYVVFDDSLPKILEINGKKVAK